jgi:putative endonuclease
MSSYVYIMSNKSRTTLYIGVTNNLERRVLEHKLGEAPGFTSHYRLTDLMYFEESELITDAIAREKQLKAWKRVWKLDLIREMNPDMMDLSEGWYDKEMLERRDPESSSG